MVLKIVYTNVNKTQKREEKGKQNYTSRNNYHPHNHHHHDGNHQWRRHHQSPNCSVFTTKAACERIGAAIYVLQVFITTTSSSSLSSSSSSSSKAIFIQMILSLGEVNRQRFFFFIKRQNKLALFIAQSFTIQFWRCYLSEKSSKGSFCRSLEFSYVDLKVYSFWPISDLRCKLSGGSFLTIKAHVLRAAVYNDVQDG